MSKYLGQICSLIVGHASQRDTRRRSHAGKRDLLLQGSQIAVSYILIQLSQVK